MRNKSLLAKIIQNDASNDLKSNKICENAACNLFNFKCVPYYGKDTVTHEILQ